MKQRVWRAISPLGGSLLLAIALTVATGFLGQGIPAFASGCSSNGVPFCATASGNVSVEQPTLYCSAVDNDGTLELSILQGCTGGTGNNYQKIGLANYQGIQQWVAQYGWTYTGTGDGIRYFTFDNYAYFQPMDTSTYWVSWSDGDIHNTRCYGGGSCDYDPWNNYVSAWSSPTAQLRIWVPSSQRGSPYYNQAFRQLEAPQPGLGNCQGNGTGSASVTVNATAGVQQGSIGVSSTQNITYYESGQCNANSDAYSTYMNMNWEGGSSCYIFYTCAHNTQSAQSFYNVTSTNGQNQTQTGKDFVMNMNMVVNWWNNKAGTITTHDLFGNVNVGPSTNDYALDLWVY